MAHEIEIIEGEASMAYAGDLPWHGLGHRVDNDISVDDMMIAANLDWTLAKHPIFTNVYDEEKRVPKKVIIENKFAVTRNTDNKVMTICGPNWEPIQNEQAFEFFREFCEVGGARMETAGSLKGGQHVWALASLNSGFKLPNGDETKGYLLFSLPHVVGKSVSVRTTSVRVVCNNTLEFSLNSKTTSEWKQTHMVDFDMRRAKMVVEMANENISKQAEFSASLQKVKMGKLDALAFFNDLISDEALDEVDLQAFLDEELDTPGGRRSRLGQMMNAYLYGKGAEHDTAWGVLNGVTYWADHVAGGRKANPGVRLQSSWFGGAQRIKEQAQRKLVELID